MLLNIRLLRYVYNSHSSKVLLTCPILKARVRLTSVSMSALVVTSPSRMLPIFSNNPVISLEAPSAWLFASAEAFSAATAASLAAVALAAAATAFSWVDLATGSFESRSASTASVRDAGSLAYLQWDFSEDQISLQDYSIRLIKNLKPDALKIWFSIMLVTISLLKHETDSPIYHSMKLITWRLYANEHLNDACGGVFFYIKSSMAGVMNNL